MNFFEIKEEKWQIMIRCVRYANHFPDECDADELESCQ